MDSISDCPPAAERRPGKSDWLESVRDILREILAHKRTELAAAKVAMPLIRLKALPQYRRATRRFFRAAIEQSRGLPPRLIAEVKHRSPSAGVIRANFDPVNIAKTYEAAGAAALSILTDEKYFGGRLEYLSQIRDAVEIPLLRKDFVIDGYQLHEARAHGADAVLLIAEALTPAEIASLHHQALELELHVLLEVNSEQMLKSALADIPSDDRHGLLLGINNRNLAAQTVDLGTTERLAGLAPPDLPIVAESGIKTRADVERMRRAGASALLIGESLLRAENIPIAIRELFD